MSANIFDWEWLQRQGFRRPTCFSSPIRTCELAVFIVRSSYDSSLAPWGVYLFHGDAAGQFWKNSPPLKRCHSLEEARGVAELLYGVYGAGALAQVINYDGTALSSFDVEPAEAGHRA